VIAIARNRYSDRHNRTSGCSGEPEGRVEICDRGEDLEEEVARLILGDQPAKYDVVLQRTELGEFDGCIKGIAVAVCLKKRRDKWVVESLQKGKFALHRLKVRHALKKGALDRLQGNRSPRLDVARTINCGKVTNADHPIMSQWPIHGRPESVIVPEIIGSIFQRKKRNRANRADLKFEKGRERSREVEGACGRLETLAEG
jgi:hypothetical protein